MVTLHPCPEWDVKPNQPVSAHVRLAISHWPDNAPRGSVTTFCAEHEISRKTFYLILNRAREHGQAAALEPRTRRPKHSPTRITDEAKTQAVQVRAALESSGLDYGPISVHDKMQSMGFAATPSIASLARIFRETGVARTEPKKKPRAAYRRFVYPAPNACWQLDATEYVLTRGRTCVIFQLQDDHSRLAVASFVAHQETSEAAIAVFKKGVAARGVPQKLLTDNGLALNPSRRGQTGKLVTYAASLGVEAITGKPYKPTTQGKNERFHQTLARWLDQQPLAETVDELQHQVDRFDMIYNFERPHQGLPGRLTPQQAWDAVAVAEPPRPFTVEVKESRVARGEGRCRVGANGQGALLGTLFHLGKVRVGHVVHAVWGGVQVSFYTLEGGFLVTYPRPVRGVRWVPKRDALEIAPDF